MIKAQRGTKDIVGLDTLTWQFIEKKARETFQNANYQEIRTPIFEGTELFKRGVGDSTDIVNKEMYSFSIGEKGTSLTLRPENTAGVVRAYIEHALSRQSAPQKLWYFGPMFRYERPQAGRQRQFHQIGVEVFGIDNPSADAEAILMAMEFIKSVGLNNLEVEINSLGCPECRTLYRANIKKVVEKYLGELCDDCKVRYEKNPLRILDCKVDSCKKILENSEITDVILGDYICNSCDEHFNSVLGLLDNLDVKYKRNKLLVRGLDYYNRTVFEIKSEHLGSQNAVCGGGRYDSLVEMLGGPNTPAVGFAIGVERLFGLIEKVEAQKVEYFVVSKFPQEAIKTCQTLRQKGISCDFDMSNRKFAKQLEKASKTAKKAIIIGEDEIEKGYYTVKNLETSEQTQVQNLDF